MQRHTSKGLAAGGIRLATCLATSCILATSPAFAASSADARTQLRESGCQTLAQRVAAIPGSGPIWLASYEPAPGGEPLPAPLRQSP